MKPNMTDETLQKGIAGLKKIRLSPAEKAAVFARLSAHMEAHPPLIVSPWRVYVSRFSSRYAIAALLLVVLTGGSAAYASEGALPGDLLYPVKLYVMEPATSAMTFGAVPQARWEAQVALRRLQEAETLAAQGRLTIADVQTLQTNFQKSAETFNTIVQKAASTTPTVALVNAAVDFEAGVNAHAQILSVIGGAATSSLASDVASLQDAVGASAEAAHAARENAAQVYWSAAAPLASTSGSTTPPLREGAPVRSRGYGDTDAQQQFDARVQAVQQIIANASNTIRDFSTTTPASSSVQREIVGSSVESLQQAMDALKNAQSEQHSGDAQKAFSSLLDSESAAKAADTSLQQGLQLSTEQTDSHDRQSDQSKHKSKTDSNGQKDGGSSERDSGD